MERHGLAIGIERVGDKFFMSLKATGKLTHEDYQVITPMLESAVEGIEQPRIRALVDGTELQGWEPRAAWDDFKLGMKHNRDFEKVAIYGNKRWQEAAVKVANWFIVGESRFFEDEQSALAWLHE